MIDVLFLVLPDSLLLDIAGPAEAFRLANQHLERRGKPACFALRYVATGPQMRSSIGMELAGLDPLPDRIERPTWLVLVGRPGGAAAVTEACPGWPVARRWLARVIAPQLRMDDAMPAPVALVTVCAGALLAADAGLLGTHRVTTHHEMLDALAARAPGAQIVANRIFVEDGALLSSAGITAGIDLALHLVARHCGDAIAAAVAQTMVVFARRTAAAPEQSPLLAFRDHLHPALHRVQDAICAAPAQAWTAQSLGAVAYVTPRHLTRLFREQTGVTPRDYVERMRVALAEQALEHGASAERAATVAGFTSPRQLRQARRRAGA